jgi:hypothetical protein
MTPRLFNAVFTTAFATMCLAMAIALLLMMAETARQVFVGGGWCA